MSTSQEEERAAIVRGALKDIKVLVEQDLEVSARADIQKMLLHLVSLELEKTEASVLRVSSLT